MSSPDLLRRAALWYARHGWRVVPLRPREKVPLPKQWTKVASTDPAQIETWWRETPSANVGIATGAASGIWVLDIDPRHGGDESLADLLRTHGALPDTVEQLTGGGGRQIVFRWPIGRTVPSRANLRPGLDTRGEGGQVVAPPSIHPSGRAYEWELSSRPDQVQPADAPAWLLDMVCAPAAASAATTREALPEDAPIAEGGRNDALFRLACRLRRAGAVRAALLEQLREVNRTRCQPPLSDDELQRLADSSAHYRPAAERQVVPAAPAHRADPAQDGPEGPGEGGAPSAGGYALNEHGNALRFAAAHGRDVKYCHTWKAWFTWTRTHWQEDKTRQVDRWMRESIDQSVREEITRCEDDRERRELGRWWTKNQNDRAICNSINRAASLAEVACLAEDLDRDPFLFSCRNGTLDLRLGELIEHDRAHLITRCCDVDYESTARDAGWDIFLHQLTGGDQELSAYLQRAAGYSMTGDTTEEKVFFFAGPGGTGKSTFTLAIQTILGSYADAVSFETFLMGSNKTRWTLAKISQCRLVVTEEAPEGRQFAADIVKSVTGGTPIEAERKYSDPFSYIPRWKLMLVANELPRVSDTDSGFWRRLRLIRCEHRPANPDRALKHRFHKDQTCQQAILAWMVAGARTWCEHGLMDPPCVLEASRDYRLGQDPLSQFLEEETVWGDEAFQVTRSDMLNVYKAWGEANAAGKLLGASAFRQRIVARGAEDCWVYSHKQSRKVRGYTGVRLRRDDEVVDGSTVPQPGEAAQITAAEVCGSVPGSIVNENESRFTASAISDESSASPSSHSSQGATHTSAHFYPGQVCEPKPLQEQQLADGRTLRTDPSRGRPGEEGLFNAP